MDASTKDSQALEHATTGAGLGGNENDARSANPTPTGPASTPPDGPTSSSSADTTSRTNVASKAADTFPDASKPGTERASEAGKSDKPKVPVPARDAQGELPSPDAVGEAG